MTALTAQIIRQAIDNNDCVINASVRSYSGRYMNGRECVGVTIESLGHLVPLGAAIARELCGEGQADYDEAMGTLDDAIADGLAPAIDNMGCDYIAYWPSVPYVEDEEDEDV